MAWYWIVLIAYLLIGIALSLINYLNTQYWDLEDTLLCLLFWGPLLLMLGFCGAADLIEGRG